MKLYGSITSPYVRRLRLFLYEKDYEFINLDIFSESDRELLTKANPAQKIPFLNDHGINIFDSNVIFRYLTKKFKLEDLSWQQENELTLINAINDSMVSMLILQRSDIKVDQSGLFFDLQRERAETVFKELDKLAENNKFEQWNYVAISLFCLLDWLDFRKMFNWQEFKNLQSFYKKQLSKPCIKETDPRNA